MSAQIFVSVPSSLVVRTLYLMVIGQLVHGQKLRVTKPLVCMHNYTHIGVATASPPGDKRTAACISAPTRVSAHSLAGLVWLVTLSHLIMWPSCVHALPSNVPQEVTHVRTCYHYCIVQQHQKAREAAPLCLTVEWLWVHRMPARTIYKKSM